MAQGGRSYWMVVIKHLGLRKPPLELPAPDDCAILRAQYKKCCLRHLLFENDEVLSEVVAQLRAAGYEAELIPDLEHGLSEIEILYPNGGKLIFDWNLASYVEFSRSVELMRSLEASLPGPFVVGENGTSESITTREDLLERITTLAKKDLNIQRYKGLGEMNPEQLWETTMDPDKRTLLQVRIEDAVETDGIFTVLMGDQVEPRRKFIEDNALDVKNLDV